MGYSRSTEGLEAFPAFLEALRICGVEPQEERSKDNGLSLGRASFRLPGQEVTMVVEQYFITVDTD